MDDGDNIYLTRTLENKLYVYNMVTGFVHIISIGKEEVEKRFPNFWASIASINIFDEVLELSSSVDCSVHQMDINGSVIKREDTFFNLNIIPSMLLKEYLYGQRQIINEINNKTPIEWFKQVENEKNSHEISAYGRNILKVLEGEDEL